MANKSQNQKHRVASLSLLRKSYYNIKPFLPRAIRLALRRRLASRIRERHRDIWPINSDAAHTVSGWPGWPDGKKFAVVLTHDVEGPSGIDKCESLAALESQLDFRSSFNFVPKGSYRLPLELRKTLVSAGFEIGVHDLKHDGKLYTSQEAFKKYAREINGYLQEWNAVGFRSGFMHHNLAWLHELDIEYDMSTFDTDPFEPQPEAHPTIFPFWVEDQQGMRRYLELPYTLPQDSTLFLILSETSNSIWKQKVEWICANGGMVLLNTHPDYMAFGKNGKNRYTYPVDLYRDLLVHLRSKYGDSFWSGLPRELALHLRQHGRSMAPFCSGPKRKVWIDLDNTPHVPFFKPIIKELERKGHTVVVTARKAFQVCELATEMGVKHEVIGKHYGKYSLPKAFGLCMRALQFVPFVLRERPDVAVSHGARSQILVSNCFRIPSLLLADYEHARILPFLRPGFLLVPEVIPLDGLRKHAGKVEQYPGIKEDVYVPGFQPNGKFGKAFPIIAGKIIVTVRPPADEAHYRSPESDKLFESTMAWLTSNPEVQIVLLPRNAKQLHAIKSNHSDWFFGNRTVVPESAVDGLELIWHSDLVVSGGGTMNREAAALGVPVYSIFRGKTGAVDQHLHEQGRLTMISSPDEIRTKVKIAMRGKEGSLQPGSWKSRDFIIKKIEDSLVNI